MTPEFSRPERIDAIGDREREVAIEADAEERRRLAGRFGIVSIERLAASLSIRREAAGIVVAGEVAGSVTQACSVTGDPLVVEIAEPVHLLFVDRLDAGEDEELSGDALDTLPIESGAIDLGEAAAETLALALDPFPRGPGAADALREAGVVGEEEAGPFGALAGLKAKLEGR